MPARALTFGIAALAALALAAGAGAVTGRVVVKPSSPTVGKSATIQVQLTAGSGETVPATLYLKVTSPRGGSLKVPMARVGKSNSRRRPRSCSPTRASGSFARSPARAAHPGPAACSAR
jgi:hypothetical protein